jgi:hypothetical protein
MKSTVYLVVTVTMNRRQVAVPVVRVIQFSNLIPIRVNASSG